MRHTIEFAQLKVTVLGNICTSVLGIYIFFTCIVIWCCEQGNENNDNYIREYKINKMSDFSITL